MEDIIEALKDCKQLMGEGIITLELQYDNVEIAIYRTSDNVLMSNVYLES